MKIAIALIIVITAIGAYFLLIQNKNKETPKNIVPSPTQSLKPDTKRATFGIFTNGTVRIFSDKRYHNRSGDTYIEASNPNVVIVEKSGTTWGDFFNTLPMKVEKECLTTGTGQVFCTGNDGVLRFFINSKEDKDALEREIMQGDQLIVTFGTLSNSAIEAQIKNTPRL